MDEVLQQFDTATISEREKSNFECYYKNRGRSGNQDERRRELLETQKEDRKSNIDKSRGILQLVESTNDDLFRTPRSNWRPTVYVSGFQEVSNYRNVLMGSEWLLEKPCDFAENWLAVACPKGLRMLVIAYKGVTKCFNKYGKFRFQCHTALPGGNPCEIKSNHNTCVLDCFHAKETNTMYVLDILAWNNCVMTEGEAAFRHYWLQSNLETIEDIGKITKQNKMIFKLIPKVPCTIESLNILLSTFPYYSQNSPPVDGLLFYHAKAQYLSGETPLVGWLYPYMLPEVLGEGINMHKVYQLEKPVNYVSYLDFIQQFEEKKSKKIFFRCRNTEGNIKTNEEKSMDTDNAVNGKGDGDQNNSAKTMDTDSNVRKVDNRTEVIPKEETNASEKVETAMEAEPVAGILQ